MNTRILYLAENHSIVSSSQARWKVIHEYDADGVLQKETWIDLKKEPA